MSALIKTPSFVQNGIQEKQAQLLAAVQSTVQPKTSISIGIDISSKINKMGHLFGNSKLTLQDKVVHVLYINAKDNKVDNATTLKTTHWFIAAIMNLFSYIFPCCVQGAAKFSIDNQECYIRRALIQKALPQAKIPRHSFQGTMEQNTKQLQEAARQHFVKI